MAERRVLITGITGQDGSYLAEQLLAEGCEVHGVMRSDPTMAEAPAWRLRDVWDRLSLRHGTLENPAALALAVREIKPDECYHLAGHSFVPTAFDEEPAVLSTLVSGTHSLLAAIKEFAPGCRFFLAGSSEMFGSVDVAPQHEDSAFRPRSIYGLSKLSGFHIVRYYREHYGIYACTGILYNHESPRRGSQFVTRKITRAAAAAKLGRLTSLPLGNVEALRDWGYAPEYTDAMRRMLRADDPDDFVIATGILHSVANVLDYAFGRLDLDWREYVVEDPRFWRPAEAVPLVGDPSRIAERLDWRAARPLRSIIEEMVDSDYERLRLEGAGAGALA